ncbi:MAG TPA: polyphosphate:AMP phosphotransferase [Ruminococcaceae bacterium]|jgi:polyphosphate:AMP phosphotransferase|nr:polyphosphate:AMP phosphotransferase [Oscillospiraceae bacterium]
MLQDFERTGEEPERDGGKIKKQTEALGARLSLLQQAVRKKGLPVILLFEGWGAAGKGGLISDLILNLDPRGFKVYSFTAPTKLERREPVLWRYWRVIPPKGQIAVLDRSWYMDVSTARIEEDLDDAEAVRRMNDINILERQLTDGGYLILKFFLHISRKEQKKRFEKLVRDKDTAWRVTERDWRRNRRYDRYFRAFDEMLGYTDTACARWHVVSGMDRKAAALEVFRITAQKMEEALSRAPGAQAEPETAPLPGGFPLVPMPKLADVKLDRALDEKTYRRELEKQQELLSELHGRLYRKKVPAVLVYEGWDAAGKGGNIRRVARALDPRGYAVVPIAAPTPDEAARHYLWRFWVNLPRDGHIAIFDRSWYGRVLVERVEGFCTRAEWLRAYREIDEFERQLCDWGAVVIKFWLQIDKNEQLRRFQDRQRTPAKQWKITDEDWRNRSKWDQYEVCVNDMLRYTSTESAPWHIVESQDKKFGRIQALRIITDTLRARLR